jgi:hypothetical protein
MVYDWQVLPSPRPALIWLGADAVCVALLALEALALLAIWRWPARPWRLGMAALVASWAGIALTLWVYRGYRDIARLAGYCSSPPDCASSAQAITDTVTWVGALSAALVVVALGLLVAATMLSARETGADGGWAGRMAILAVEYLITSLGVGFTAEGVFDWITFAPLMDPQRAGDGLGLLPLYGAISATTGGAIVTMLAGYMLLAMVMAGSALPWRRPRAQAQM